MTRLTRTLEVDRPIGEVFAFVADFTHVAEWDPGSVESRKLTPGDVGVGVGTEYDVVAEFNGRRLPLTYVVREWTPPRRVVLEGTGSTFRGVDDISFEPTASGGTRVTCVADLRLRGPLRAFEPFLRTRFERTGDDAVAGMRRALEARRDGGRAPAP